MADQRQLRDRTKREFLPTDPKDETPSFGSANGWGRRQLNLLGVHFAPNAKKRLDLNKIMVCKEKWSPDIEQRILFRLLLDLMFPGVARLSRQLASIDVERDLVKGGLNQYGVKRHAPDFKETFTALVAVMTIQVNKLKEREANETKSPVQESQPASASFTVPASSSQKQSPTTSNSIPSKRPREEPDTQVIRPTTPTTPEQPKTPDQPTQPSDPKFTSSSAESKGEPNTNHLLYIFIMNTLYGLEEEFANIPWQNSGQNVYLAQTYVPS